MIDKKVIIPLLIKHEDLRLFPYTDSVGKLSIGVGRNLTDVGLTKVEAIYLCSNSVDIVISELQKNLPYFNDLPDVVQLVLIDMGYNMGVPALLQFRKSLAFIQKGDYDLAAGEILLSKWATQVGQRATDLSNLLKTA